MPQLNDLNRPTRSAAPMAPQPAARPLLGVARSDVTFGQLFRRYDNNGRLGEKLYGSIGNNGRFYSINMGNGEIAAADDGSARVKVVGTFTINASVASKSSAQPSTRGRLTTNDLFRVKGGKKIMANLGRLNDGRYVSLNMASHDYVISARSVPSSSYAHELATTKWSNKKVEKVGTYSIDFRETARA